MVNETGEIHNTMTKPVRQWRVVYGETMPIWEGRFGTKREAAAFAKKHRGFGDIIFAIERVVPSEGPRSLMAAIAKSAGRTYP